MSQRMGDLPRPAPYRASRTHQVGWPRATALSAGCTLSEDAQLPSVPNTAAILEAIGTAALLLDAGRRVVTSNELGARLLQDAKLLTVDRSGRLKLTRAADEEALEKGFARVSEGRPAMLLRLGAPGAASAQLARLLLLRESKPSVLLVLHQLAAAASIAPPAIQVAFALSAAEARLAGALVAGGTLAKYAAEHGLSRNTARNQLAAIFVKTGTRRQTELVATVVAALGPAWGRWRE